MALFSIFIACTLCSLLLSCASADEPRTLLKVELPDKLLQNKLCLTWGYEEAQRLGMQLYLPPKFNAVFHSGDPVDISRKSDGALTSQCPGIASLAEWLQNNRDKQIIDVFVNPSGLPALPRTIPAKKPFHHLHLSASLNLTSDMFLLLKTKGDKLVVTCDWTQITENTTNILVAELLGASLDVLDLCSGAANVADLDVIAAIAMASTLFFGFTNAEVSAYVIQERRRQHLWAAELIHTETTSLVTKMFEESSRIPWIFTYNDASPSYDYMIKALVRSSRGGFHAFCLFEGDFKSPIALWLIANSVKLMAHKPLWGDQFWEKVIPFREENLKHSHLYASKTMVVGTWQRIDIPIIHDMQQFHYMLFTDADVFFHKLPVYRDILNHAPTYVGMAPEMQDIFPYNAGIMIMNIRNLISTYDDFLGFILSNEYGLYFPNYGPGDQGAYNQFYEDSIRKEVLPKIFNGKPYQDYNKDTRIVHFHGPKPVDYHQFFTAGTCRFGNMCHDGLTHGLCQYVSMWAPFCLEPECANYVLSCAVMSHMCQASNT